MSQQVIWEDILLPRSLYQNPSMFKFVLEEKELPE